MESVFVLLEAFMSVMYILPMILGLAAYILTAMAFYSLAKRRGIRHAWLSWIPVGNGWILGSLSDQFRYVAKGQKKSKRHFLLWLKLAMLLVSAVSFGMTVASLGRMIFGMFDPQLVFSEEAILNFCFSFLAKSAGFALVSIPLSIAYLVFTYMALYDVYLSCEPDSAVLYLVLSILVSVTQPFFLFFSRNKDKGMPPRRPAPQVLPAHEERCGCCQCAEPVPEAEPQEPVETPELDPEAEAATAQTAEQAEPAEAAEEQTAQPAEEAEEHNAEEPAETAEEAAPSEDPEEKQEIPAETPDTEEADGTSREETI